MTGSSDPFLEVSIGKITKDTMKESIKNTLNPVFGKVFEYSCILPYDHTLVLTVKDYDKGIKQHDVIGSTTIDLENRFYTKHRATCGLPESVKL